MRGLQWERCLIYMNDICFGLDFGQALENLSMVLVKLMAAGLKLEPSKCNLFQDRSKFLSHIVSSDGSDKLEAIENLPNPQNVTDVQ